MRSWEILEGACHGCTGCSLAKTRTNVVIGVGNRNADLLFVGEGPGRQEDLQGEPFVGPAGQLLDKMLAAIGLTRQEVYIANVVKCRPPENRDPTEEERAACIRYLRYQLLLLQPKMIVCLGRIAAITLISPDFRITRQRGEWVEKKGYWMTATYHPAALLRDPAKKRDAWTDMQAIRDKLAELQNNGQDR